MEQFLSVDEFWIITSNLSPDGFAKRYGERVIDRIRENGRVRQIAGESMRKR